MSPYLENSCACVPDLQLAIGATQHQDVVAAVHAPNGTNGIVAVAEKRI